MSLFFYLIILLKIDYLQQAPHNAMHSALEKISDEVFRTGTPMVALATIIDFGPELDINWLAVCSMAKKPDIMDKASHKNFGVKSPSLVALRMSRKMAFFSLKNGKI